MIVKLNDKEYDLEGELSLSGFIQYLGLSPRGIAIAMGGAVIPKTQWDSTMLADKMELMLIHAVSGG